jgi:hypothetical protein
MRRRGGVHVGSLAPRGAAQADVQAAMEAAAIEEAETDQDKDLKV